MKKRLAVFLLTCIMLTGCTKVIDTQRESTQNNVPTVKSDVEKDFENLTLQANLGDASSQAELGLIYYYGRGVPQDYSKAFYWLQHEPPRDCRRLNFLREYGNENTKLYPRNERASRPYAN